MTINDITNTTTTNMSLKNTPTTSKQQQSTIVDVFQSLRIDTSTHESSCHKATPISKASPAIETFDSLVFKLNHTHQPVFSPDGSVTPTKSFPTHFLNVNSLSPTGNCASPRSPCSSHSSTTSFWYSKEEPEHVQSILTEYCRALDIDKDRTPHSRQPKKFIGRVKRMCMNYNHPAAPAKECSIENEVESSPTQLLSTTKCNHVRPNSNTLADVLHTFDEVSIYARDLIPYASDIPFCSNIYCITSWTFDGIPQHISLVDNPKEIANYLEKSTCEDICLMVSYLFCLPTFSQSASGFSFFSSNQDQQVTFSDPQSCFLGNSQCKKTKSVLSKKRKSNVQYSYSSPTDTCNFEIDFDENPLFSSPEGEAAPTSAIEVTEEPSISNDHLQELLSPTSPGLSFQRFSLDQIEEHGWYDDQLLDDEDDDIENSDSDDESEEEEDEESEEGDSDTEEEEGNSSSDEEDSDDEQDSLQFRNKWKQRIQ